jgi:HK97 family phage prohead protease
MSMTLEADVAGRRQAAAAEPQRAPFDEHRDNAFAATMRATTVDREGKKFYQLDGIPSVVETWYDMWDFWGPYEEKIAAGAFDATLATDPDVAFLLNHRGMTMARTKKSRTLELSLTEDGSLASRAFLNPERQDVQDLVRAVEDGDVDQMSFAFRIKAGNWNPDFTTYTITEVDLDRGDVSAVNYGANPYTSIEARARLSFLERSITTGDTRAAAHTPAPASTSYTTAALRHALKSF